MRVLGISWALQKAWGKDDGQIVRGHLVEVFVLGNPEEGRNKSDVKLFEYTYDST